MTDFGSRHKASHQDGGGDEIDCAGLDGRVNYVDRGDPADTDFTETSLTTDGTWRDLNCAGIVPEGAKAIHIRLLILDNLSGQYISFREKGNANEWNLLLCRTIVSNIVSFANGLVACDQNRVIQYKASDITWTAISITVRGWLI